MLNSGYLTCNQYLWECQFNLGTEQWLTSSKQASQGCAMLLQVPDNQDAEKDLEHLVQHNSRNTSCECQLVRQVRVSKGSTWTLLTPVVVTVGVDTLSPPSSSG